MVYRRMGYAAAGTLAATGARDIYRTGKKYLASGRKWRKPGPNFRQPKSYHSPITVTNLKRFTHDIQHGTRDRNVIVADGISELVQGTAINNRERQMVHVKGVKLVYGFRNTGTVQQYLRLVVLQAKNSVGVHTATSLDKDLFRGSGNTRAINFGSVSDAQHKYDYAINNDKWNVLYDHKSVVSSASVVDESDYRNISRYIPINKTIHFNDTASTECNDAIYILWWSNDWDHTGTTTVTGGTESRSHCNLFYQDVV